VHSDRSIDPSQQPETVMPYQNVTVSVNVTDTESGVAEVVLSYSIDSGTSWSNVAMYKDVENTYIGLIPGFSAATNIWYKIVAHDNSGNVAVDDNAGQYYVYTAIPEFPNWLPLTLTLLIASLCMAISKRKMRSQGSRQ
jgi:hypothetical protein